MKNKSDIRHDILNIITSLFSQLELLKREGSVSPRSVEQLHKKIKDLHQEFLKYVEAESNEPASS